MKKILLLLFVVSCFGMAKAQDRVVKNNGETINVKVLRVDDEKVYYKYEGEDVEYQISKGNISEITFKSGRKEVFGNVVANTNQKAAHRENEYVITNTNMNIEDKMFIYNLTGSPLKLAVKGKHYKTGEEDDLCDVTVSSDSKERICKSIEKGHLDHYSKFMFITEEPITYSSAINGGDLNIWVYRSEQETMHAIELKKNQYIYITYVNKKKTLPIRVQAYNDQGELINNNWQNNGFFEMSRMLFQVQFKYEKPVSKIVITTLSNAVFETENKNGKMYLNISVND